MTYEEARKMLKENKPIPIDGFKIIADAYDMAIKALEKQIPKKPYDTVSCPLCKIEVELQPIDIEQVTYCLHCGQAIDWSDDE